MMFENHRQHRAADKASEEHHDGDGSETLLNEQGIEAKHDENRRVLIEILDGD